MSKVNQIESIEAKIVRLQKQKRDLLNAASRQERKADTRRKVLVGAAILEKVESDEWPRDKLVAMMDKFLTRDRDRELFDLPSRVSGKPES